MAPFAIYALAPAAFLAGLLMFLAPCTLPIVPSYLVFIAGDRRHIFRNALAFVVGFSLVFILLGLGAGAVGSLIGAHRYALSRIAGLIIILFGLSMLGAVRLPVLGSEWHAKLPSFLRLGRPESSLLIGALFALGWSPCIGPILGTVLLLASQSSTALMGAVLLGVFSLGLAVPFLLTALLIDWASLQFSRWGRALTILSRVGGILLIVLGIAIVFGAMGYMVDWGYSLFYRLGYNGLYTHL